jgi:hypothetical protein
VIEDVPVGPTGVVTASTPSMIQVIDPEAGFGVTVAVNVTSDPRVTGFGAMASDVEVGVRTSPVTPCWTGWLTPGGLEPSPAYAATSWRVPTTGKEVVMVATPATSGATPKSTEPPPVTSRNATLPVAVAGVTVAVSVTSWPMEDGFGVVASPTGVLGAPSRSRPAPKIESCPVGPRSRAPDRRWERTWLEP